jgi:hypothetical protein
MISDKMIPNTRKIGEGAAYRKKTSQLVVIVTDYLVQLKTESSIIIWLILPVVICLSQRLSHACISSHLCMVKPRMAH